MSKVTVKTSEKRFATAKNLYGLFFEDINRAGDGGLYPELIRNRSFEDSILPPDCTPSSADVWGPGSVYPEGVEKFDGACEEPIVSYVNEGGWRDTFNGGEGILSWVKWPRTPVPAWYTENAEMTLNRKNTLNKNREASLDVHFSAGGRLKNIGYAGMYFSEGEEYELMLFAKAEESVTLSATLESEDGKVYAEARIDVGCGEYGQIKVTLTPSGEEKKGVLVISSEMEAKVNFGFTSLLPKDTYNGHGLRKDLVEILKNTDGTFLRFPGGCIVEGVSRSTCLRFSKMIGPIWERPSVTFMWHYRSTQGLGYHEYLQLCEDLGMDALYVFNCGMSCQARSGLHYDESGTEEFLQEAIDAIEYARASVTTKWGKMRADAGHPEPFPLPFVEIGNENGGPEYNKRYKHFYEVLKARYPDIVFISNTHTEREGLTTEIADEHYYSTPYFFAENVHFFDNYPRKNGDPEHDRLVPDIFIGEYEASSGPEVATLFCALAEAMYLTGVEKNQDVVKLTAYAPMMQNVDFTTWMPNLIVFNNHKTYGIPTYHTLKLLAENRGETVIKTDIETHPLYKPQCGRPGITVNGAGAVIKNVKYKGERAEVGRLITGSFTEKDGEYLPVPEAPERPSPWMRNVTPSAYAVFGEDESESSVFEFDASLGGSESIVVSVWNSHHVDPYGIVEPKDDSWNSFTVDRHNWEITPEKCSFYGRRGWRGGADLAVPVEKTLERDRMYNFRVKTYHGGYDCYIDGELVASVKTSSYGAVAEIATEDEKFIYLKLVSLSDKPEQIEIELDCDVKPTAKVELITGDPHATNSFDSPELISSVKTSIENASRRFTYSAPAYSLSVLKLEKE